MVSEERITNGYFTYFTYVDGRNKPNNWTWIGTVDRKSDYSFTYSTWLYAGNTPRGAISQSVNFVGVTTLTLYHGSSGANYRFHVLINGTELMVQQGFNSGVFNLLSIPIPSDLRVSNATLLIESINTAYHSPYINRVSALATVLSNFTMSNSSPLVNKDTVTFTDTSTGSSSWLWDFGDGITSTLQNPTHMYTSGGSKTVTLQINGGTTGDYVNTSTITVMDPRVFVKTTEIPVTGSGQLLVHVRGA